MSSRHFSSLPLGRSSGLQTITSKYQAEKLRADKAEGEAEYQGKVIANQALNFNRFNQIAENASRLNSLVDIGHEKTVIKYREVLLREKNCDFPVPVDIAVGLLNYANRLRASALHADSGDIDSAGDRATTPRTLTYCQAVLWINPLLAAIEKANNQLAGVRCQRRMKGDPLISPPTAQY